MFMNDYKIYAKKEEESFLNSVHFGCIIIIMQLDSKQI